MFRVKKISFWPKINQINKRTLTLAHKCEQKIDQIISLLSIASVLHDKIILKKCHLETSLLISIA